MLHLVAVMRDDRLNYQQDKTKGTPVNSFRHSISCHCCSVYLTPPTNKATLWSRRCGFTFTLGERCPAWGTVWGERAAASGGEPDVKGGPELGRQS